MPRRPRLVIPGIAHHITQRGNNRQDVFLSDQDRRDYIKMLRQHALRHEFHILGWCLMTNHIHLVAVPSNANSLSLTLGQTHAQYSLQLNRRQGWIGHVWQNRFFSCPLEPAHLLAALRYVDLNPVRAGLVNEPCDWPWSSAHAHSEGITQDSLLRGGWVERTEEAGLERSAFLDFKLQLASGQATEEATQIRRATKLGEPLGSEGFVSGLERQAGCRLRVLTQGRPPWKKSSVLDAQEQNAPVLSPGKRAAHTAE